MFKKEWLAFYVLVLSFLINPYREFGRCRVSGCVNGEHNLKWHLLFILTVFFVLLYREYRRKQNR
ncbi:MAG: hypothetical protein Q4B71_02455 [Cardiobacteriaceae bacterium]|nr:hypothetical protein [Cardiobacteriaceae bacterium]